MKIEINDSSSTVAAVATATTTKNHINYSLNLLQK